MFSRYH